jgi:hypothetical protein
VTGESFRVIAVNPRETRILVLSWFGAAALILLVLFIVTRGTDDATAATTPPASVTTTTSAPSETTVPGDTTTTSSGETTSSGPSTTLTTSPPNTTLSTSPPSGELLLKDDGTGGVDFGATPDEAIAFATSALGTPDDDSGWVDSFSIYGTCPRPVVRGVEWGSSGTGFGFVLLFTRSATSYQSAGTDHFFGYYYVNGNDPAGLKTLEGITIGSAVGDAEAAYSQFEIGESPFDPLAGSWNVDRDPSADTLLWGFSDGLDSTDLITTINGGITCGE